MPNGDGTGPRWARGCGCGRVGFRRFQPMTKEEEIEALKSEQKALEAQCLTVQKRLAELK